MENVCLQCQKTLKDCLCEHKPKICDICKQKIDLYGCACDYRDDYDVDDYDRYDDYDDEGKTFISVNF